MKQKLQTFEQFCNELLPHEAEYLHNIQRFEDPENQSIMHTVWHNAWFPEKPIKFDTAIDKRKYSRIKKWIENALLEIDVNEQYKCICSYDLNIMTDKISADEEREIIGMLQRYLPHSYHFVRFYEMLQNYRHFLLIRMRYNYHDLVVDYLDKYKLNYFRSKKTNEQLHTVTADITAQYKEGNTDTKKWEKWLESIFYNEQLDGLNRYFALVRITFISFNYRDFSNLLDKYNAIDEWFKAGKYYSRPILLNYYSNRLLIHSKYKEWQKAKYYGYLSIRHVNKDYLHYAINLVAVLMRQNLLKEALQIMQNSFPELKSNLNFHSRTGFVAMYVKCLNLLGKAPEAESYAANFLSIYKDELFKHRWHLFFSSYLQSLLRQEKYQEILRVIKKYNIMEHERNYQIKPIYLPTITWYFCVAQFKEGKTNLKSLEQNLIQPIQSFSRADKLHLLEELITELTEHIPFAIQEVSKAFKQLKIQLLSEQKV